jgi:FKBP-type peptidyl-prolyl cis-trans isomerase FklB
MKRRKMVLLMAGIGMLAASLGAAELKTPEQRFSYTLGVRMAKMLSAQGINRLDGMAFGEAVADVINGGKLQLTEEQMAEALKWRSEQARKEREERAAKALEKSKQFMAGNAGKPGVKVLDSGVQYQVIREGEGTPPTLEDKVKVHYEGRTIDGKKFDSSYDRGEPATFALKGVVKGFSEALTHMKPGAKWKVYIPPELGYGKRGAGNVIGPNETLIFDLELIEVLPPEKAQATN